MKRYGSVIKVKKEAIETYKRYHAAVWPEVLSTIRLCNIRNYSIYLKDDMLFGYFEYHGADYAADMAKMARDPKTQESGGRTWKRSSTSIDPEMMRRQRSQPFRRD